VREGKLKTRKTEANDNGHTRTTTIGRKKKGTPKQRGAQGGVEKKNDHPKITDGDSYYFFKYRPGGFGRRKKKKKKRGT